MQENLLAQKTRSPQDTRYGVYHVCGLDADGAVRTLNDQPFPLKAYGRFKYCDGASSLLFAEQMASMLVVEFGERLSEMYFASSGIKHVPSAAYNLLQLVIAELALMGYPVRGMFRIDRGVVKAVDYATLSLEERAVSNSGRRVALPDVSLNDITGHPVVVVDDIRISGQTEAETRRAFARVGIEDVAYAYLVLMDEEVSAADSSIESVLNQVAVQTLHDLSQIICSEGFMLNARTCKFILRAEPAEVAWLATAIPASTARQILSAMIADGYHAMSEYQAAFTTFRSSIPRVTTPKG